MTSNPGTTATAVDCLVTRLLAAWNTHDASARHRHLQASWSDAGRYSDPLVSLTGREAVRAYMTEWRAGQPERRLLVRGDVVFHHAQLHFNWAMFDEGARETLAGCSVAEFDERRGILRLSSFFMPEAVRQRQVIASAR